MPSRGQVRQNSDILVSFANNKRPQHVCYYCGCRTRNIAAHLKQSHPTEEMVSQLLKHPNKSAERRRLLTVTKRKGKNFLIRNERVSFVSIFPYKNGVECQKQYYGSMSFLPRSGSGFILHIYNIILI